jgi:hypothetical protein
VRTLESMTSTKPAVFVRFHQDVKDALDDAASKDGRSLSGLLEKIAVDWLRANGHPEISLNGPRKKGQAVPRK